MTKSELIAQINETLVANKANKTLTAAIQAVLDEYKPSKAAKREKVIEIDGTEYVWCTRHEVYEIAENFTKDSKGYHNGCKLTDYKVAHYTKIINELQKALTEALDNEDFESASKINKDLKELKLIRGSKYNLENDIKEFPEVQGYNYEAEVKQA
jgi:protein-arginine kinase activator protein McsA